MVRNGQGTSEKLVSGLPALQSHFAEVKAFMEEPSQKLGREMFPRIRQLKTYLWCFDGESQGCIRQWIEANAAAIQAAGLTSAIEDSPAVLDVDLVEHVTVEGAASRSLGQALTPNVKKAKAAEDKAHSKKMEMMKLAVPKDEKWECPRAVLGSSRQGRNQLSERSS